eukprot:Plantae.Rhodophyta-Hildenbrandia_rubra.ctg10970.p1 GENE.Plantae.Rhodophyta-Hildenbrandia_rubra.ctg10970~~Plantae.Rhodophyta-Hildenbrandia_rubra.ctg10970.p1  ORF type:complete len:128 (-),score=5.45 Plantae.Rhodophyta-Hildenbrandia_rubra.ctg10970:13-396(-)
MSSLSLSSAAFELHASKMIARAPDLSRVVAQRRFRALFGASPAVCATAWNLMRSSLPPRSSPAHLLWGLLLLKAYSSEHVNCAITGSDEKTSRKWSWAFIKLLSDLQAVSQSIAFQTPRASLQGCSR